MSDRDRADTVPDIEVLRALAAQSRELAAVTDAAGTILWANERFARVTGIDCGGRLQAALAGDAEPRDRERSRLAIEALLAAGSGDAAALACRGADAAPLWLDGRAGRAAGHTGRIVWSFVDVTAERFLAVQARRQGELLDTAQEFGRLGLWERRIPSGEGRWDRHVFRFWGLDPQDGTPPFQEAIRRIHPEDRARMNYEASTHAAGRYAQRYRVIQPDGTTRWIHSQWEVKNGPDDRPDRAVGIMMDDTDVLDEMSALGDVGAQLRLAVDLGEIAIWRHDLTSERMYYNDRAFAMLGLPVRREGIPIDEVRAFIHGDDLPRVLASAEASLKSDAPVDTEARYRHADGGWRVVMTRRVVERDRDGRPMAFIGVALDMTEAIEQRRRSEELARRLEAASQAAGVGIWSTSADVDDTDWNAQMFVMFDRFAPPRPPAFGEWLRDGVHADDRDRVARQTRGWPSGGGGPFEIEFRARTATGTTRWIVMRAAFDRGDSSRRRLLGVALDVTAQHTALEALREAGERSRLITRYAGIGTWEARLDGGGETWDDQMFALRGMAPRAEAPTREERLALVHPDDLPDVLDSFTGTPRANLAAAYEFRIRLADGRWRWLASRSAAVVDAHGVAVRRVGVNWDVTETKEAENARQQAAIAEREIQAKSQFLSRMSHELRTPLNAVLGFTQLLQIEARRAGEAAQADKLGHIRNAGNHLLSLINDVLDLSGLESGELRLSPQTVDLGAQLREAVPLVEPLAAQSGVAIRVDAAAGTAHADPARLRQVLINLLSNAVKYNRRGGTVMVETRSAENGVGVVVVRDTGRGLTPEQLARLFEPFNRFGVEREGIDGTGIGLVIVKALVGGMGGRIDVASTPGVGTRIEVTLPAAVQLEAPLAATMPPASEAPRAFEAPASSVGAARGGRILYIEDNPVNVLLVEELVRTVGGLTIDSVAYGVAGVARAGSDAPDLVLVDLQLPDIDGFEVLRRLRADPKTRAIACVALSANAMPDDIERGLAAGFTEYWTKPIDFAAFLAALRRLFPLVQSQAATMGR